MFWGGSPEQWCHGRGIYPLAGSYTNTNPHCQSMATRFFDPKISGFLIDLIIDRKPPGVFRNTNTVMNYLNAMLVVNNFIRHGIWKNCIHKNIPRFQNRVWVMSCETLNIGTCFSDICDNNTSSHLKIVHVHWPSHKIVTQLPWILLCNLFPMISCIKTTNCRVERQL